MSRIASPRRHEGHEGFHIARCARRAVSDCLAQRRYGRKAETILNFVSSLENTCARTIWATNWHEASVIPAKAGIHPLSPLDAGLRRHDESREEPCGAGGLQFHTL